MKNSRNSHLLSSLPRFLEAAKVSRITQRNEIINFSIAGKTISIFAPSERTFTKILGSAFCINEEKVESDIDLVIVESQDTEFMELLNSEDSDGNLLFREYSNEQFVVIDRSWNAIYFLDRSSRLGGVWAADFGKVSLASFITPLRALLSLCIEEQGAELVHAAGIEIDKKGVMLTGPSGSGKSTLALYAALNGHGILGDDAVLVHDGKMKAIYKNAKIEKREKILNVDRHRRISLNGSGITKDILPLVDNKFNFIIESDLRAVVLPFVGNETQWKRMKKLEAIKEFMPQTTKELLGGTNQNIKNLLAIVNNFPFFTLELSEDLAKNLSALKSIAEEV